MRLFQHNAATKPAWNCNMKPDRRPPSTTTTTRTSRLLLPTRTMRALPRSHASAMTFLDVSTRVSLTAVTFFQRAMSKPSSPRTPSASFSRIGRPSRIRGKAQEWKMSSTTSFATGAERGAKRLLAVVILVGLTGDAALQALHRFARFGIDDGCQPIRSSEECPGFYSKKTGEVCNPWDKVKINNFCRDQWRVMAHVFTKEGSERILSLDVDCILPIISQSETESAHGAFEWVKRVTLHENHHLDPIIKVSSSLARRHKKHPLRGFSLTRSPSTTVRGPTWPSRTFSYRETNGSGNGGRGTRQDTRLEP